MTTPNHPAQPPTPRAVDQQLAKLLQMDEDVAILLTADGQGRKAKEQALNRLLNEVARLRDEVSQLKAALQLGQQNCDDVYEDLREERDAAKKRRDEWKDAGMDVCAEKNTELTALRAEVTRLTAALAEAEKDTQRLDWCIQNGAHVYFERGHLCVLPPKWCVSWYLSPSKNKIVEHADLRTAIDAARPKQGEAT